MGGHAGRRRARNWVTALVVGGGLLAAAVGTVPAVAQKVPLVRRSAPAVAAPLPAAPPVTARARTTPAEGRPYVATGLAERRTLVGGVERSWLWQRPPGGEPAPVLLALHGLHGTAAAFADETGLPTAAAARGLVLVLPRVVDQAWNDGRLEPGGPDDTAFLLAVLDELVAEGVADPDRVVVAGFSNGAGMAMVLAARHPERVAAAVAISGELLAGPDAVRPDPAAPAKVPLWVTHGDADLTQPWGGRPQLTPLLPALASVDETVGAFRTANGTWPGPTGFTLPAGPALSGPVQVTRWSGLAPVTLFRLPGGVHDWPQPSREGFSATDLVVSVAASAHR